MIHTLVYEPVFNLLILLFNLTGNLGIAILLIAFLARLITFPLTQKQIKAAGKNKEFQKRMKDIRKKYKNNQEKLSKEMAKIQAEFLPGQIGGCLNIIISILLLFQIRNVVIDLFNQGVHAFNTVAYSESMKFDEDSITKQLPEDFEYGVHELRYDLVASNGVEDERVIKFAFAENEEDAKAYQEEIDTYYDENRDQKRGGNISAFVPEFEKDQAIVGRLDTVTTYFRAPSNASIDYSQINVFLDGGKVEFDYSEGEIIDLSFIGMDLSKVASDFDIKDFSTVWPYVTLSVAVGITQFFASRIQTGLNKPEADTEEEKEKKKSKDEKEEEPDFSELMAQSSQRMIYFFPLITVVMSMGYLGGAGLFPSGVSLFWTGQNTFVIIQQLISNRDKVAEKFKKGGTRNEDTKNEKLPVVSSKNKREEAVDNKLEVAETKKKSKKKNKKKKKKSRR